MNILNETDGIIHSLNPRDARNSHNPYDKYCDKPNNDQNCDDFFVIIIQKTAPRKIFIYSILFVMK